jgi:uncharacterized protein YpiB (UPF0302 family)
MLKKSFVKPIDLLNVFQLSKKYEHGILKYVIFDQQLNNKLIFYLNLQACKQGLLQHLEHLLFYGSCKSNYHTIMTMMIP